MYRGKRFVAATMAAMMMVSAISTFVSGENIVFAAKMSKNEGAVKAKVDKITSSLKTNYLGLKNVGQWQQYIKEARALAGKLPSGSVKNKYIDQINKAEALVNAAARVNKVEQSMSTNAHSINNATTWEQYINLAKTDLAKVDKNIFGKQISELNSRIASKGAIIANIKAFMTTEKITIANGNYPIHGELMKPKNAPANMKTVVIVGDAGPTDRNGGTDINTPYKDIAEGLAKRGIASFRFDKRYYTYGYDFTTEEDLGFTVGQDYVEDYSKIMSYLGGRKDINKDNIFALGFGQGGSVLPMLDGANGQAKGYIFMGANKVSVEDTMLNILITMINESPELSSSQKKEIINAIKVEHGLIGKLTDSSPDDFFLDMSTKYWLSYKGYDAGAKAMEINKPMLFLHGGNDYMVPSSELKGYESVLSAKANSFFKEYAGLTSEFIPGAKNFDAYSIKGKVSQTVIDDIVIFLGK
ncbi:MAG: alpha/beta hydrolase [Clostridium sp.]